MRWLAGLACRATALLLAVQAAAAQPVALGDGVPQLQAVPLARAWVDPSGSADIAHVSRAAFAPSFEPTVPGTVWDLPAGGALWLHLRLQREAGARQDWLLKFPMPILDRVAVYQEDDLAWRIEEAGDTLPVRQWPERGRYPIFRLDLPAGETRDVYVRIAHATPAQVPMQLATAAHHSEWLQVEYLGLGGAFGALLLLIAGCLAKSWAYRDREFAWYALYAGLTSLAVAAFTGVAGHLLWPGFGLLADALTPMLACAALAAALLFVRHTLGLRRRLPLQDRLVLGLALAGMALAPLPAFTAKAVHLPLVGIYMTLGTLAAVLVSGFAWRRGDAVAGWVFAAQLPMVASVIATVFRVLGWIDVPFVSQYVVVLALTIEVPLLLVALFMRSRDRHNAQVREQALTTHDALTGLLAPHLFHDRLSLAVTRFRRDGQNAAVMYIELVNHARIREVYGSAVAEQSLLRSVIKLRRLLRDVDTVSRVGEARFGVILEGAGSRNSVMERATRLIAAGLMPLPGLKPDVTLQFHVAAVLLSERLLEPHEAQQALAEQLARMSPRTRRPIRFLQAEQPASSEPGESAFPVDVDVDVGDESELPA